MFDREPNIDIVFRNGLKNMEVLPPADVWDNIPPMPVRPSRFRIITGIAAGVAALVSLTLLATWYIRSNTIGNTQTELIMAGGELQAVTIDGNATPADATLAEESARVITMQAAPPQHANEAVLSMPAEEPLPLLASADMPPSQEKNDESVTLSPDDITIIASDRLPGLDEGLKTVLTPGSGVTTGQRFMVGASVSPAMGLSPGGQDIRLSELMNSEKSRPSYSTGLTFGYKISNRLTIQSGIGLASIGQTISGVDVFAGLSGFYAVKSSYLYSVETAAGLILAGNTDLYLADSKDRVGTLIQGNAADPSKYQLTQVGDDIRQVFRYLELPLVLRYKVIDSKVGLNLSGGVAYGFLVDNMAYTGEGSDMITVGYTEGINPHSLSSQLGLGMEYNISKKISFNLEPVFRYYMTPLSDISGPLYKPYSVGVFSGFFFKF